LAVRVEDLVDERAGSAAARAQLRSLLGSVAWFELERRRLQVLDLSASQVARLVRGARERSYATLIRRLDDYHGQSRFELWAAKFAVHETAAAVRRHGAHREEVSERCLPSSR
jgi:hypothetical protein